jgi:hypothetical protein
MDTGEVKYNLDVSQVVTPLVEGPEIGLQVPNAGDAERRWSVAHVEGNHLVPIAGKPAAEMRAEKTGPTRHQRFQEFPPAAGRRAATPTA